MLAKVSYLIDRAGRGRATPGGGFDGSDPCLGRALRLFLADGDGG